MYIYKEIYNIFKQYIEFVVEVIAIANNEMFLDIFMF